MAKTIQRSWWNPWCSPQLLICLFQVELESRDDRGANASGICVSTGLIEPSGVGVISNIPTTPSRLLGTDIVEANDECISTGTNNSASSLDNSVLVPFNNLSSTTNKSVFVFDASSQQFIDSMKYTDLALSVEHPSFANPVVISCHKFMLAKKVEFNKLSYTILYLVIW